MKRYVTFLLDWDGCMAMTLDIWLSAYITTFNEYGLNPDQNTITRHVFGDWQGPAKLGIRNTDEFTRILTQRVNDGYLSVDLYPGVQKTLIELKRRPVKLALLTSTKRVMLEPALVHHRLSGIFDVVLTAEDVTKHKPDPEIIFKALEMLGNNPEKSLMVGDSKSDLGAARNAGIDSMLYYPQHNQTFYDLNELSTYAPTYTIREFPQILGYVPDTG